MKATHKIVEGKTNRQLANEALKAMGLICEADCGTIRNHYEIASYLMPDGRTILETIYQDGYVRFNNGWFIVEVDDYSLYVDVTGQYIKEFGIGEYEIIDTVTSLRLAQWRTSERETVKPPLKLMRGAMLN